jgi:chemotaxis protein MotA
MDLATIIGLGLGMLTIVVVLIMDGGSPAELFAHPSAILLIWGGALSATTITGSLNGALNLPKLFIQVVTDKKIDVAESIDLLVKMADKARKEGLLALEEDSKKVKDEFLQKGLMMVVDGIDASQIKAIVETNIEQMEARHRVGINFFAGAGGFAPTFGIIGTVMGLISVLKQLDDPSMLAKSIAAAFLATLWGLLSANLIFLPISGKLKFKSQSEANIRRMQLEGILSIQAGENPRIVREKLTSYLPPNSKAAKAGDAQPADAKKPGAQAQVAAEKAKA